MFTIERLKDDDGDQKVKERLRLWEAAKESEDLYAIWACSDSRLILPDQQSIHILSLTAGGPRSPFKALLSDHRIKADVVVCHHDGDEAVPGQSPGGCGGREAKKSSKTNSKDEGAGEFISAHVWDPDLFKQSYFAAAFTAFRSNRLTLATTQDHLNLITHPLSVFYDGGRAPVSEVPQHFIFAEQYFPDMIYENGIPVLRKEKVPDIFREFFDENLLQASQMAGKFTDLAFLQKRQNPSLLVISGEARPFSLRHPYDPGEVFRVSIPRQTIDGDVEIKKAQLTTCLRQVHYPAAHFTNLDTILIETRSLEESVRAAELLKEKSWMKDWFSDPGHQILVAQVRGGITENIVNVKEF